MLRQEFAGQPYNKAQHRRSLLRDLNGRTEASIEFKHRNISAALRDLGYLWIPGYLPAPNYQQALMPAVESWLADNPDFDRLASDSVERQAVLREDLDLGSLEEEMPPKSEVAPRDELNDAALQFRPVKRDYAAIEARNRSLGLAGEELIVEFERHRLGRQGLGELARKVEQVSRTRGDGCGFDVLSYHPDGREHFIEVKTTCFAPQVPFFTTAAELRFSQIYSDQFSLVRVFNFRQAPRFFRLAGAIADHCVLDAVSFRCRLP